ncbi:MAG: dihydrofolate reductase family protein [Microthrixaceae bacterium]
MHLLTRHGSPTLTSDLTDDAVTDLVMAEPRTRADGRPWVMCNMVTTLDGAATVEGVSGALGGAGDKVIFAALRARSDVIVAGSATVLAERYRLPRAPHGVAGDWRGAHGKAPRPRLCIVTSRGGVPDADRLIGELPSPTTDNPQFRPIIATTDAAPDLADERFDVIRCGADSVDPTMLVDRLAALGCSTILCEGGPNLLGQFAANDLIDEWDFTIAATIVSGDAIRTVTGPGESPTAVSLDRGFIHHDGTLLLRYLRSG